MSGAGRRLRNRAMTITVLYDNEVRQVGLQADWGFAALIETESGAQILFDTGADGPTLRHNSDILRIDLSSVAAIVISHAHWDHAGGLAAVLEQNRSAELYVPSSLRSAFPGRKVTIVGKDGIEICESVFSTGELEGIEQSLALKTEMGVFVITGCAHPKMQGILDSASRFGRVYGIAGGFHGFRDFKAFDGLSLIYPCHCTQHKREILDLFKGKAFGCGAGLRIEL